VRIYSGHENFSESTEEIAPLTEEEKKQRLEELRAKMTEKKAKQAILDKEEQKKNEVHSVLSRLVPLLPTHTPALTHLRPASMNQLTLHARK
jgi:Tfp pilus assembly protein PilO